MLELEYHLFCWGPFDKKTVKQLCHAVSNFADWPGQHWLKLATRTACNLWKIIVYEKCKQTFLDASCLWRSRVQVKHLFHLCVRIYINSNPSATCLSASHAEVSAFHFTTAFFYFFFTQRSLASKLLPHQLLYIEVCGSSIETLLLFVTLSFIMVVISSNSFNFYHCTFFITALSSNPGC